MMMKIRRRLTVLNQYKLDEIIRIALEEDIGSGDITTLATVDEEKQTEGMFIAKEDGVICGLPVVKRVFEMIDAEIKLELFIREGEYVKKGSCFAKVSGRARNILTGERVALNFLQRMSGIATQTRKAADLIQGTKAVICDTRKTTPGLRILEKYAVRTGGGANHRYNLADGILIKDNHIRAAGGIGQAIVKSRGSVSHMLKIEVEVENFDQIEEALLFGADIIMLDNMNAEDMRKAVDMINKRAIVEASGNMGDRDLLEVARTGVDIISVGALTHSVRSMDISLKFSPLS